MALSVWLPLTGNLYNQGTSKISATGTNITISTPGKIGSCYSFNGTSSYITLDSAVCSNATTEFSFTCWVKFNSIISGCLFSNRTTVNPYGVSLFVNNNGNILFDIGNERRTKQYTFLTDTWYHLAFTYKKGAAKKIYINGFEIDSVNSNETMTGAGASMAFIGASQDTSTTVNDNYLNGYLNDVKIWNDYCLSPLEVKEIAQGLVLHYKLDDISNGIQDSSGYGHNGEIIGSPASSSDTPRYSSSIHFTATSQCIKTTGLTTSGFGSTYTFTWWDKCATYSEKMTWGFSDGVRLNGIYNGTLWNTDDGGNNPLYIPGTTTQVSAPIANIWHHFAMVSDGTTCKVYKDGELWGQAKTFKTISGTTIYLNGWDAGTSYKNADAFISDFRIYCTPLLDNDIKLLYNSSMRLDNFGKIHVFELNENENKINLTKSGQLKCGELNENKNIKFYKSNVIEAVEFIEK